MVPQNAIRKMTNADVLNVYMLDQLTDPTPWSEKLFADCIKVGYDCWVMLDTQTIVGFAIVHYAANEAHLLKLAINPDYQGQGLGQKMLLHVVQTAKSNGADEMFLEVRVSNQKAIALYQNNNFVEIGMRKGYYPADALKGIPSEDALTMALPLW